MLGTSYVHIQARSGVSITPSMHILLALKVTLIAVTNVKCCILLNHRECGSCVLVVPHFSKTVMIRGDAWSLDSAVIVVAADLYLFTGVCCWASWQFILVGKMKTLFLR